MIIWISSYPKSGNTWVRYFLKSYFEPFDKKLTLKSTKLDDFYTLNFPNLPLLKELNIDYSNFANIIKNWIPMQSFINLNNRSFLSECKIIPVPADPSNKAQHFN